MSSHFLYVIAPKAGIAPCKIGISKDPDRRVKQLQTGFPERLMVHYREPVPPDRARFYERQLLREMNHLRTHGEWLDLSVETAIQIMQWVLIHYADAPVPV
jgi:hypothetical protein